MLIQLFIKDDKIERRGEKMGLLDLLRRKEQTVEDISIKKVWKAYDRDQLEDSNFDLFVLCDYVAAVSSDGHEAFFNANYSVIGTYIMALKRILPVDMYDNMFKAYQSYESDFYDCRFMKKCDNYFVENRYKVDNIMAYHGEKM